jgi:hypothetical protein
MFLFYILIGWFLASIVIKLSDSVILNFFNNSIDYRLRILSKFIIGICFIMILYLIPLDFSFNIISSIDCIDEDDNNPYVVTVGSNYFNTKFSFDMSPGVRTDTRTPGHIKDLIGIGVIGKCTVSAVKSAPAPIKAVVAVGTSIGLGSVAVGLRVFEYLENKTKVYKINKVRVSGRMPGHPEDSTVELRIESNPNLGGTKEDQELVSNNIEINSILEDPGRSPESALRADPSILDGIQILLYCIQILSILCIVSFILYTLFIYFVHYGINRFNKTDIFILKNFISLARKSGNIYIVIWGTLTLFSIVSIFYFSIRLTSYLEIISNL